MRNRPLIPSIDNGAKAVSSICLRTACSQSTHKAARAPSISPGPLRGCALSIFVPRFQLEVQQSLLAQLSLSLSILKGAYLVCGSALRPLDPILSTSTDNSIRYAPSAMKKTLTPRIKLARRDVVSGTRSCLSNICVVNYRRGCGRYSPALPYHNNPFTFTNHALYYNS